MNGPDVVAEGCTHFPQLLIWEKKEKPEAGTEVGIGIKRIRKKNSHICVGFFLTPIPRCPRSATVTSTKNVLQYYNTFGLPV